MREENKGGLKRLYIGGGSIDEGNMVGSKPRINRPKKTQPD